MQIFFKQRNLQSSWEYKRYSYKQVSNFTEPKVLIQDVLVNSTNYKKEVLEVCPEGQEKSVKRGGE